MDNLYEGYFQDQYIAILYWTMITLSTLGYGDITSTNNRERVINIVVMAIGATIFSYIVADLTDLISSFGKAEAHATGRITELKEFLTHNRIGTALFGEVVSHFKSAIKHSSNFDEDVMFNRLPVRMREALLIHTERATLEMLPLFRHMDNASVCLYILKKVMQRHVVDVGRSLVREDDPAEEVVFMIAGTAEMRRALLTESERRARRKIRLAKKGDGDSGLLAALRRQIALEEAKEVAMRAPVVVEEEPEIVDEVGGWCMSIASTEAPIYPYLGPYLVPI